MKYPKYLLFLVLSIFMLQLSTFSQTKDALAKGKSLQKKIEILPGAVNTSAYLSLLRNKKVGIFANQTSMLGKVHLVDSLRKLGVNITVIFGPEHGFRGTADAGEKVGNFIDSATGIPVVSLYGAKRAPSAEDLKNVDVLIFDIQDVGVRFYTFISSLEAYIEAAIEFNKPLIVLDRPNPNGFYVDGPVLQPAFKSFIGMQPIPVVYGMTIGEYASMLVGEKWLSPNINATLDSLKLVSKDTSKGFRLKVIPCKNYTHQSLYTLPVNPSPNLPDMGSIYWYPSTCFFEGTVLSEGRGTPTPFQVFGHPSLPKTLYAFTPVSTPGAKEPKLKNQLCYGWNLASTPKITLQQIDNRLQLGYLLKAYQLFPEKDQFFILPKSGKAEGMFFNKLAGNKELSEQIKQGLSEEDIRKTWEPGLKAFKIIRKKYLLYAE
jgi:uncharacterized protein YbbC (DUF1343 family)